MSDVVINTNELFFLNIVFKVVTFLTPHFFLDRTVF